MALLAFAGAEDGLAEVTQISSPAIITTNPRTGTNVFQCGADEAVVLPITASSHIYIQGAWRSTGCGATEKYLLQWKKGATILGCLTHHNTPYIKVYLGNKATLLDTLGSGLPVFTYMVIEVKVVLHDTNGIIEVKIDGQSVYSYAGDTMPGADADIDSVAFFGGCVSYNTNIDDIAVCDNSGAAFNSWMNGMKIHRVAPSGAGNYAQWTPSAGDNYACVDETPPSMADYVESATPGHKDSYAMGDAAVDVTGIAGVVFRYWGQGGGQIKRLCRVGSTDYLGAALTLPGSFNKVEELMSEKPGGGAWDVSTFNAMEAGMEKQ